ncbi:MAG: hypothetical protein PF961_21675 [Planctomycetota bacterium]|jgi:hypothetical protein|nr:hypothetical protein [Planctomycetota bacterium]
MDQEFRVASIELQEAQLFDGDGDYLSYYLYEADVEMRSATLSETQGESWHEAGEQAGVHATRDDLSGAQIVAASDGDAFAASDGDDDPKNETRDPSNCYLTLAQFRIKAPAGPEPLTSWADLDTAPKPIRVIAPASNWHGHAGSSCEYLDLHAESADGAKHNCPVATHQTAMNHPAFKVTKDADFGVRLQSSYSGYEAKRSTGELAMTRPNKGYEILGPRVDNEVKDELTGPVDNAAIADKRSDEGGIVNSFLVGHWRPRVTPNTWNCLVDTCGNKDGEHATKSANLDLEAYPDDRYHLKITMPALFSVALKAQSEESAKQLAERVLSASERQTTLTAGGHDISKPISNESAASMDWAPTCELKRNGQDIHAGSFDTLLGLTEAGLKAISALEGAVSIYQNFVPQWGWYLDSNLSLLQGELHASWGWKEVSSSNKRELKEVAFGHSLKLKGSILSGKISVGGGLKFHPIKTTRLRDWGIDCYAELQLGGELAVDRVSHDHQHLFANEEEGRDILVYSADGVYSPAKPQKSKAGWSVNGQLGAKVESRLMVGLPWIVDIKVWTEGSVKVGLAMALNQQYLDAIELDAELARAQGNDVEAEKLEELTDEQKAKWDELKEVDTDGDGELDARGKFAWRSDGIKVFGYIKFLGATFQPKGDADASKRAEIERGNAADELEGRIDDLESQLADASTAERAQIEREIDQLTEAQEYLEADSAENNDSGNDSKRAPLATLLQPGPPHTHHFALLEEAIRDADRNLKEAAIADSRITDRYEPDAVQSIAGTEIYPDALSAPSAPFNNHLTTTF